MSKKIFYVPRSFQGRMIFSTLIIAGLTWVLGLTVIYYIGKDVLEQKIGNNFKNTADETGKSLARLIESNIDQAYALSSSSNILSLLQTANRAASSDDQARNKVAQFEKRWEDPSARSVLEEEILTNPAARQLQNFVQISKKDDEYVIALITDKNGIVVASSNVPRQVYLGDQPWWRSTIGSTPGQAYVSDIEPKTPMKEAPLTYVLSIAVPIYASRDSSPVGVLLMVHPVKKFFEVVTRVKSARTDHTMLAGSDGNLLFCPIFLVKNHLLQPELIRQISQNKPGWGLTRVDVHHRGSRSIHGFAPVSISRAISGSLGGHDWYIFTSQDPKETYAPIDTLLTWVAGSGLLGIGALAFFSFYATGRLMIPLKELQKGTKLFALGDLHHRLKIKTGDEIEELSDEFNEMAEKIKASYTELEQKVAQRTHDLAARNKELSSLYAIASVLNKSLNLTELLDESLSTTIKIFGTEVGLIHLLDETESTLRLVSAYGISSDTPDPMEGPYEKIVYSRVVQKGVPISSSDKSMGEIPFKNTPFPHFITLPIRAKGKIFGTLSLLDKTFRPFVDQDLELLIAIGNQIGVAIDNARLYEETKKVDQLKSDFVSKVSHEFRTPLTSIKGFIELLLSDHDFTEEKKKEFLNIVSQESDRLIRLINDVLDISKIEAGKVEWKIEPLDLSELIHATAQSTQTLIKTKKLQLVIETPPDLPQVLGDRDQLIQVLNNLLSNAIKFTDKGAITLFAKRSGENDLMVGVRDTGVGLPPAELTKIFNKFYQVTRPEKGLPKGTGLGLAICREIILHLKGKIWCESVLGKGSTFLFTLPIVAQMAENKAPSPVLGKN